MINSYLATFKVFKNMVGPVHNEKITIERLCIENVFNVVKFIFTTFLDICTKCDGMKIVTMLNTMFGIFDNLSDRNDVYKVETVKDSFVGVSGAPEKVIAL